MDDIGIIVAAVVAVLLVLSWYMACAMVSRPPASKYLKDEHWRDEL